MNCLSILKVPHGAGFPRKDFAHFIIWDNKKYVHKKALRFIYTNGDTYLEDQKNAKQFTVNNNAQEINRIEKKVDRIFSFIQNEINQCQIYPKLLLESENFFVFKYYSNDEWEMLESLTKYDTDFIKRIFLETFRDTDEVVTPFYNQMFAKLYRNKKNGDIVMVDIKGLQVRPKSVLTIFMYDGVSINNLYLLERRFWTKGFLLRPYMLDYSVRSTNIIRHY